MVAIFKLSPFLDTTCTYCTSRTVWSVFNQIMLIFKTVRPICEYSKLPKKLKFRTLYSFFPYFLIKLPNLVHRNYFIFITRPTRDCMPIFSLTSYPLLELYMSIKIDSFSAYQFTVAISTSLETRAVVPGTVLLQSFHQ